MPGKRAPDALVEKRVADVFKLLLRGASREDVLRHLAENDVQAERTADFYISKANAKFKALSRTNSERELGRQLSRLEDLYQRVFRIQDYRTALAVTKERSELLGLYPDSKVKHEHSGPGGGPIQLQRVLPDGELEARLRAIVDASPEARALPAPDDAPPGAD